MKFTSRWGSIALLLAGALAPASAFGGDDGTLIAPGRGIGAAALGMTEAQAIATFGKPSAK
jgi:hypothetical protein